MSSDEVGKLKANKYVSDNACMGDGFYNGMHESRDVEPGLRDFRISGEAQSNSEPAYAEQTCSGGRH